MQAVDAFPALVISLDFELYWGMSDIVQGSSHPYWKNLIGARRAVEYLLRLFQERDIHATWATVGFLFAQDRWELENYLPIRKPDYTEDSLNNYLTCVGEDEQDDHVRFAESLIQRILETPGQELASHTFSHYYCAEKGQTEETFREDLKAAQSIAAAKHGISMRSLAFPRNQVNVTYLPAIVDRGFDVYRGNPKSFLYDPLCNRWSNSLPIRFIRLIDAYCNLTGHHTLSWLEVVNSYPFNVRASRFLRPYVGQPSMLEELRRQRIIKGIKCAAERKEIYHLWWHPHNFGTYCRDNMDALEEILNDFDVLRETHGMRSLNMVEVMNEAQRMREQERLRR